MKKKNLNLHILAKSIDKKDIFFPKVFIGKKVYLDLRKERNNVGLRFVLYKFKILVNLFFHTSYTFLFMIINYISPNFAVYLHEKIKKIFKR